MLDRKTLKGNAKEAFKANYWRCVAVALIMTIIIGGTGLSGKNRVEYSVNNNESIVEYDYNGNGAFDENDLHTALNEMESEIGNAAVVALILGIVGVIAAVAVTGWLIHALVINPLSLGCKYFFTRNSDGPAGIGEIGRGFSPAWWHNVLTLFLTNLFVALWMLLFIVPGVVKLYSYRLVPYIQAENPEMRGTEAITLSRHMMDGHKWEAFVFDLSFIGWYLLVGATAGIAGLFWVNPYKAAADAELYKVLRDGYRG